MMTPLIAFTGLAGSGKSTAATALRQYGFKRMSFADPIRDMLRVLGLKSSDLSEGKTTPQGHLCGKTPREAMQTLGTEWGRKLIGETIWVDATQRMIIEYWASYEARSMLPGIVIDDCRFDNEAEMIRSLQGKIVLISRPGTKAMDHASERGISPKLVDEIIINDGDPSALVRKIEKALS